MARKTIFVTGGCGYIGSHTLVELIAAGYECLVFDNLSNSSKESIARVEKISGGKVRFFEGDICDLAAMDKIFAETPIDSVIHFAGLKAVGESSKIPLEYYAQNIGGTINLLKTMDKHGVGRIVFSSSATVYAGNADERPCTEDSPLGSTNPYGRTKLFIEEILRDWAVSKPSASVVLLRYFNPVGAHPSGLIGEDPKGIPNNLVPFVAQCAIGRRDKVSVFGNDYDTIDGTGVRDYIHVVDLAKGHVKAIEYAAKATGTVAINLGKGDGNSVLQVIDAMRAASGKEIPVEIVARRPGDIATLFCDPKLALELLGWKAELSLTTMMQDTWRWQSGNPNGYEV